MDIHTNGRKTGSLYHAMPEVGETKKGSNSVNTVDRVMVLALCTSADSPLSK